MATVFHLPAQGDVKLVKADVEGGVLLGFPLLAETVEGVAKGVCPPGVLVDESQKQEQTQAGQRGRVLGRRPVW